MIKKAPFISLLCAAIYMLALKLIISFQITLIQIPMLPILVSLTVIGVPLYAGMLYIRKNCYNNSMNFGQAFYSGIILSILTACFVFGMLAILELSDLFIPDLIADNKLTSAMYIKNYHPSPEEIIQINQNNANSALPYAFPKVHFALVLLISAFSSTILSLFIRNRDTFTEIK